MDDFYTLLQFGKRCAVFALRERRLDFVVDGLTAVAMIDPRRIDERDAPSPLALLAYVARSIGADAKALFAAAAELALPDMREIIVRFSQRPWTGLADCCYAVVETAAGTGFVDVDVEEYPRVRPGRASRGNVAELAPIRTTRVTRPARLCHLTSGRRS